MPSPEDILAAARLADIAADAFGEWATVLEKVPGGPVQTKVAATLRGASNLAKSAPGVAFKTWNAIDAAQDAYEKSGTAKFVAGLRARGVVVNQPPPAHRQGGAK